MIASALGRAGAFVRGLAGWRAIALAFVSGAAGASAFAPFGFFPSLLASFAILVLLLDSAESIRQAALRGWSWGFGQFLAGLYWVGYAFMVDPEAHAWQMPFAVSLLAAGLALFPGLAAGVAFSFWRQGASRVFLFAGLFSATEWLRGHVFTGFPWNLAAYGWGEASAFLQSAALIGVYGTTLLTVLLGASFSELFGSALKWKLPAAMTLAGLLIWAGGEVRLSQSVLATVPGVRVRVVQPNVPQAEKYKRQFVRRNWERLVGPSLTPATLPISILVWPEAAPPFLLEREPVALETIRGLTQDGKILITGAERVESEPDGDYRFFNALVIFGRDGRLLGTYDKFHLVPFGEYLPFASILSQFGIAKLTHGEAGFSAGSGPQAFDLPNAPSVGPLICYEILFPGGVIGNRRPGWFVNVTDDSWFGPSTGPYQHLFTARARAIEEGIPVIRAANTGISAVIDPLGRTIATLGLNKFGALDAPLPAALAPTPYARFGDLGFGLLLIACGAASWMFRRK